MKDLYYISENERWINGFRRLYSVTTEGVIYTFHYDIKVKRTITFVSTKKPNFSATVSFSYNRKVVTMNVANLIYETFVRELKEGEVLVPINGDKTDLRLENIKVVMADSLIKSKAKTVDYERSSRMNIEILLQKCSTGELICFDNYEAAKEYGLNAYYIQNKICSALTKGETFFRYKREDYQFLVA